MIRLFDEGLQLQHEVFVRILTFDASTERIIFGLVTPWNLITIIMVNNCIERYNWKNIPICKSLTRLKTRTRRAKRNIDNPPSHKMIIIESPRSILLKLAPRNSGKLFIPFSTPSVCRTLNSLKNGSNSSICKSISFRMADASRTRKFKKICH